MTERHWAAILGYQGARLAFAVAMGGAVLWVCYLAGTSDMLAGLLGGAWGMAAWMDTA